MVALFGWWNLLLGDVRIENEAPLGDQPEFMDFEHIRKNTLMNLCDLAKSSSMPQELRVETRNLTNFTNLKWRAPNSGKVKGLLYINERNYQPGVGEEVFTTDTKMDLHYSKDNYFFAEQSVSEDGNEGLPVLPSPAGR